MSQPENAPLSFKTAERLKKIKAYTDNARIVANDPLHWYVPYLLKKEMLHLTSFRYYQFDDIAAMVEKKGVRAGELVMLESPEYALPDMELARIKKALGASSCERIHLDAMTDILRFK